MSLCRSFANPPVACLVRDKCRCRFFAIIQMSLSLFCYNTNVAVVLNLWDAACNFYNLPLLVPVSEDQPRKNLRNFTYKFLIASSPSEIKVTEISL